MNDGLRAIDVLINLHEYCGLGYIRVLVLNQDSLM